MPTRRETAQEIVTTAGSTWPSYAATFASLVVAAGDHERIGVIDAHGAAEAGATAQENKRKGITMPDESKLVELMLAEDHPGQRGVPFKCYVGAWDEDRDEWTYDLNSPVVTAIDRRRCPCFPQRGATGLFAERPSKRHGTIYECVSLDCFAATTPEEQFRKADQLAGNCAEE